MNGPIKHEASLVILEYEDIMNEDKNLSTEILKAYG